MFIESRSLVLLTGTAAAVNALWLPPCTCFLNFHNIGIASARRRPSLQHPAAPSVRPHHLQRDASTRHWRETPHQKRRCTMGGSSSFRTEVEIRTWPVHNRLGYADSFFLLGSCFSDNIGERLSRAKLQTAINPSHGLLFSPLSAAASLDRMISGVPYREDDEGIVFSEGKGLWSSLNHHSTFSSTSRYLSAHALTAERIYLLRGCTSHVCALWVLLWAGLGCSRHAADGTSLR